MEVIHLQNTLYLNAKRLSKKTHTRIGPETLEGKN